MPTASSNFVAIKSIDRGSIEKAVKRTAAELRRIHPEIERLIWFGSWITGLPSARSDVDLCIVISDSRLRPRDRVAGFLPSIFPTGLDILVFTKFEFEQLAKSSPSLFKAIAAGIDV